MTEFDDPIAGPHPEELLAAYALNALPEGEALQVESHLDVCSTCREEAVQLLGTVVFLSQAVEQQNPPLELELRLMAALGRATPEATAPAPVVSVVPGALFFGLRFPWPRILAPAAVALVVLLAASMAMNFRYFGQVDKLSEENSSLTARVLQFSTEDARLMEFLQQEEMASYLMANPSNETVDAGPARRRGGSPRRPIGGGRQPPRHFVGIRHVPVSGANQLPCLVAPARPAGAHGPGGGRLNRVGNHELLLSAPSRCYGSTRWF